MATPRPGTVLLKLFLGASLAACSPGDAVEGEARAVTCIACHGGDDGRTLPVSPNLNGMNSAYVAKQLRDFRDGRRSDPVMSPLAASLSDEQIEDLAAYFASKPRCSGTKGR